MSSSGSSYLLFTSSKNDPHLVSRKKIYIAESMDELVVEAEKEKQNDDFDFDATGLTQEIVAEKFEQLYQEASELLKDGDEEKAFLIFFRYSSLYFTIRDLIQDERELKKIRVRATTAIKKCEALKESLARRYQAATDLDKAQSLAKSVPQPPVAAEQEEDNPNECQICFEREVNCVLIACGHQRTCFECAQALVQSRGQCPFCRQHIERVIKVFKWFQFIIPS